MGETGEAGKAVMASAQVPPKKLIAWSHPPRLARHMTPSSEGAAGIHAGILPPAVPHIANPQAGAYTRSR